MFKAIKDNKIIAFNETGDFPCLVFDEVVEDKEHQMSDYVMVGEEFVLDTDVKAIEKQKENVRQVRNSYLEEYVDLVVSNPLRWADMSEEEKKEYSDYRKYLLDYPESSEDWYKQNPKTFEEFKGDE